LGLVYKTIDAGLQDSHVIHNENGPRHKYVDKYMCSITSIQSKEFTESTTPMTNS